VARARGFCARSDAARAERLFPVKPPALCLCGIDTFVCAGGKRTGGTDRSVCATWAGILPTRQVRFIPWACSVNLSGSPMEHSLFPQARRYHWSSSGLTERQERVFNVIAVVVVVLMMSGWAVSIVELRTEQRQAEYDQLQAAAARRGAPQPPPALPPASPTQGVTSAILDPGAGSTAFLNEAALAFISPLRGYSGKLRATFTTPGAPIASAPGTAQARLQGDGGVVVSSDFTAPKNPGIYDLAVQFNQAIQPIKDLSVVTLVPFGQKKQGRIGLYFLGNWPFEKGGMPKTPAYADPSGFILVTEQNQNTMVSAHFRLRDFLTKTQFNVWPKYLLLNPKLLDKLELVITELEASGHPVKHLQIMSGFRTPSYNVTGGNTQGRANLSRHMYGDASDVFVDNDGNGAMDDLNHDGRVDVHDAEVIQAAVDRVERRYPALVGGVGVYSACCGHGPFTHIDVRGYRARWIGFGNG
jgi:uncharacterized protein YcbK (DUF882 family)